MTNNQDRRFHSATAALNQLSSDFNDWCEILTLHSVQAAYAIIAANWAVHGRATLTNDWSLWSLTVVIAFLAANLGLTSLMIRSHFKQFAYAELNPKQWQQEYLQYESRTGGKSYWPYTRGIEYLGVSLRLLKTFAPLVAAVLFIVSLFT